MKQMIDLGPKVIALLSFAILALTVFHEWGYFLVVGSMFLSIASAYDYLSNAILWLPWSLLVVSVAMFALTILEHFGFFQAAQDDHGGYIGFSGSRTEKAAYKKAVLASIALFGLACADAIVNYLFLTPALMLSLALPAALAYVAFLLPLYVLFQEALVRKLSRQLLVVVITLPLILIIDVFIGMQEAVSDLSRTGDVYLLFYKDDQKPDEYRVNSMQILRSFDKGLLVRDPIHETIDFIRWVSVRSLTYKSRASRLCRLLPRLCSE